MKSKPKVKEEVVQKDISAKEARSIHKEIIKVKNRISAAYTDIAELLHEIMTKKAYLLLDHESFENYVEVALDFKQRKAYYFVGIWESLHLTLKISKKILATIDWSKAAMLLPLVKAEVMTRKNWKSWIKKAQDMTQTALRDAVENALPIKDEDKKHIEFDAEGNPENFVRVSFKLAEPQKKVWDNAVEKAKASNPDAKDPYIYELMAISFLSETFENITMGVDEFTRRIEKIYGVKVIVLKGKKVVYGKKLLRETIGGIDTVVLKGKKSGKTDKGKKKKKTKKPVTV